MLEKVQDHRRQQVSPTLCIMLPEKEAALTCYICSCDNNVALFTTPTIANKALEDKLQEMNGATDKSVVELKERIQVLEKELDNANELLSSSKLRGLSSSELVDRHFEATLCCP